MKKIILLGSTGSVGVQTLDIASKMKNDVCVVGLSARLNISLLKRQIKKFKPKAVCLENASDAANLQKWLCENKIKTEVYSGKDGLEKLAVLPEADTVVSAIVGSAGLNPVLKAIEAKKNISIANKEALVTAGAHIMSLAEKNGVKILPVDSEHSAIFQCLIGEKKERIKKILLTASGGPFYNYKGDFSKITVEQALNHPTWKMGKKITVDSATLMNKGLEAIEASVLFDIAIDKIEIVIHPQSIIHSMVEYVDGSVIAQMSNPDMKLPIQYALTYPDRNISGVKPLNLTQVSKLEFYEPDFAKFPCLKLAYAAAKRGFTMPAVMSAANEAAVAAFLNKEIKFTDISKIVEKTMKAHKTKKTNKFEDYIEASDWAKKRAERQLAH
ncbi:MAG: 1-deoxy-D-xylulose-5-phosphate reductoisomerase [Endomicrobium sp.]|jgi:1-deoxy-D-xylulose-5-phosphate reductoisomerase|nr:1-deoxy-D-xylulose-5-phosphate reductoisomerase [Endomicrobium sp.]